MSVKVVEIGGKEIPGEIFGVAYKFGERLTRTQGVMEYGGATITARRTGDNVIVLVDVTGGNFITTPRLGGVGGYYPTPDSSDTSQTISIDDDGVPEISRDDMVYGNTDWRGINTAAEGDPSDAPILTWKGVASRHFEVNPDIFVDGYMTFDEEITVEGLPISKYTPFGPNIYQNGEVLDSLPGGKILGAAFIGDTLICIAGMNYRDIANPDGATGGFYNELWVKGSEWERVAFQAASRPTANWFFNRSGTEAQCVQNHFILKCFITPVGDSFSATFSATPACSGNATGTRSTTTTNLNLDKTRPNLWVYDDPADWQLKDKDKVGSKVEIDIHLASTRSCIAAVDYVDDVAVYATAAYSLDETSLYDNSTYNTFGWLKEFAYDAPPIFDVHYVTSGDQAFGVGDGPVSGFGGCPPYKYMASGPFTVDENTGVILSITCVPGVIGGGSIVGTDALGATASRPVRLMTDGVWVLVSSATPCQVPDYSFCTDLNVPAPCDAYGWNYEPSPGVHPNWSGSTATGIGFCKFPVCSGQSPHSCGGYLAVIEVRLWTCT